SVSYSLSHSLDNSSDRSDPVLVDSYDLAANRASSNFDQRHLLSISYVYQLPLKNLGRSLGDWLHELDSHDSTPQPRSSRAADKLLDRWELSGVTVYQSGVPFTIINSAGNTGISLTDNAGVASGLGIAASFPDVAYNTIKP